MKYFKIENTIDWTEHKHRYESIFTNKEIWLKFDGNIKIFKMFPYAEIGADINGEFILITHDEKVNNTRTFEILAIEHNEDILTFQDKIGSYEILFTGSKTKSNEIEELLSPLGLKSFQRWFFSYVLPFFDSTTGTFTKQNLKDLVNEMGIYPCVATLTDLHEKYVSFGYSDELKNEVERFTSLEGFEDKVVGKAMIGIFLRTFANTKGLIETETKTMIRDTYGNELAGRLNNKLSSLSHFYTIDSNVITEYSKHTANGRTMSMDEVNRLVCCNKALPYAYWKYNESLVYFHRYFINQDVDVYVLTTIPTSESLINKQTLVKFKNDLERIKQKVVEYSNEFHLDLTFCTESDKAYKAEHIVDEYFITENCIECSLTLKLVNGDIEVYEGRTTDIKLTDERGQILFKKLCYKNVEYTYELLKRELLNLVFKTIVPDVNETKPVSETSLYFENGKYPETLKYLTYE